MGGINMQYYKQPIPDCGITLTCLNFGILYEIMKNSRPIERNALIYTVLKNVLGLS